MAEAAHGMLAICFLLLLKSELGKADGHTLQEQLETADQQLDSLTSRVVSLSRKLEKTLADQADGDIQAKYLSSNMDRQEGKVGACQRGFFPCGAGWDGGVQCVRDYLVCDGSADCRNGADEADVCDRMPFTRPLLSRGFVQTDACQLRSTGTVFTSQRYTASYFYTATVNPWFPSRPVISWKTITPTETTDFKMDLVFPYQIGFYNYATEEINTPQNPWIGVYSDIIVERPADGKMMFSSRSWRVFADTPCMTSLGSAEYHEYAK